MITKNRVKQLILLVFLVFFISSCSKIDNTGTGANAPTVYVPVLTTNNILPINSYSALAGGSISDSSSTTIISRGVCYSTSPSPTLANRSVASNSSSSNFSVTLTGLIADTLYYACAYATNSAGTGYGNQVSFSTAFAIGQSYEGGIIFYIDVRGLHGLIVDSTDLASPSPWGCGGTLISAAGQQGLGYGQQNTTAIINSCSTPGIAAALCHALVLNSYSDWYLPSADELQQLYTQRRAIGGLSNSYYWSSTEYDANTAYCENLGVGGASLVRENKDSSALVRPIRSF